MISKNKINLIKYGVLYGALVVTFQNCSNGSQTSDTGASGLNSLSSAGTVPIPTNPQPVLPPEPEPPAVFVSRVSAQTMVTNANYNNYTVDVDLTIDDADVGKKGFVFVRVVFPENSNGIFYANSSGQLVDASSYVPAFKTYDGLQKKYSYKSILNNINLFGEGKDLKGNQGAIMYIGYGFGNTTEEGLSEMNQANRFVIADRIMGVRSMASGTLDSFMLSAQIMPGFLHTNTNLSVFIGAITLEGEWFFLVDSNQPWISVGTDLSKAEAAFNGMITSEQSINIVPQGTDISSLKGVRVFMGYGLGSNPMDEMVVNGRFLKIYEVPQ